MKTLLVIAVSFVLMLSSGCEVNPNEISKAGTPVISFEMVLVEGGSFEMGDLWDDGQSDEQPVHMVELNSFYISKYEITQYQYEKIMGANPSLFVGLNYPVETVNWINTVEFCNQFSLSEGFTPCYEINDTIVLCDFGADGYRLPTEAEWEFAARGGNLSQGYLYSGSNDINEVAWYNGNLTPGFPTSEVGLKNPNELGLYDMSGNVWEWCWDYWDSNYYSVSPENNPTGPENGTRRIIRGGSYHIGTHGARNSNRNFLLDIGNSDNGFRIVRNKNT